MESSEWPSVGIYAGTVHHLGNWHECMSVSYENIRGQYCIVEVEYDFQSADASKQDDSVWNALKRVSLTNELKRS